MSELKNLCIKIPLLQEIKDILIYTKIFRYLCIMNLSRWKKDDPTIQVVGKLASLLSTKITAEKYVDRGNPIVTVFINKTPITNTLIKFCAAINVMTLETLNQMRLHNILPTPIVFELTDRSKHRPEGILEDVIVTLDSWEYLVDFYSIQPKTNLGGNPLILERPWLAILDAFIGCRSSNMTITHDNKTKQITLYPPTRLATEIECT